MRIWPAALALALVLGLGLLAACGSEDEDGEEEATTTPAGATTAAAPASGDVDATETPQASATSTPRQGSPTARPSGSPTAGPAGGDSGQAVGCEFPSDIESFRFEMTMKANLPATPEAGTPEGEEPLGGFLGALTGLMGDMQMVGAIILPDRTSMEMSVGGHEFGSFVQIGSKSWAKVAGLTDWKEEPAGDLEFLFSPMDFCETTEEDISSALAGLEGEKETVNGIEAVHYHIDQADVALFEGFFGGAEDTGELPEEFAMDVWLAEDGNWPVRMTFAASGDDGDGQALSFEISIEFKDFNDSSITIEPPI